MNDHVSSPTSAKSSASHNISLQLRSSVLAKEWKSGAPPLLIKYTILFDVVERMQLKPQLCFDL